MDGQRGHIDQLIVSYLSGELDDLQIKELKSWIDRSDENKRYFMQYQEIWVSSCSEDEIHLYDSDKAFECFRKRVSEEYQKDNHKHNRERLLYIRNIYKYAAAVFILGFISYMSFQAGEENLYQSLSMIKIEAPVGGTSKMLLPDSTIVILNGGSRLAYSQNFGVKNRNVDLDGEAYFEVSKNETKPFCVESEGLRIKVLGTKFNVQNYPEDKIASVSLMEGKVALDNIFDASQYVELAPGERAEFDKETGVLKKNGSEFISNDKAWMNGEMIFEDVPLVDVVKRLSRNYGVHIMISNEELKKLRIVGRFNRNIQSINEVMSVLEATGKLDYNIHDNTVTIY